MQLGDDAGVAQLVEHQLPKLRVAGSIPVARLGVRESAARLYGPPALAISTVCRPAVTIAVTNELECGRLLVQGARGLLAKGQSPA